MNAREWVAHIQVLVVREHGALAYVEALADDVPMGKLTSFPRAVKLKPGDPLSFGAVEQTRAALLATLSVRVYCFSPSRRSGSERAVIVERAYTR